MLEGNMKQLTNRLWHSKGAAVYAVQRPLQILLSDLQAFHKLARPQAFEQLLNSISLLCNLHDIVLPPKRRRGRSFTINTNLPACTILVLVYMYTSHSTGFVHACSQSNPELCLLLGVLVINHSGVTCTVHDSSAFSGMLFGLHALFGSCCMGCCLIRPTMSSPSTWGDTRHLRRPLRS